MDSTDVDLPNRRWTQVRPSLGRGGEAVAGRTLPAWRSDAADSDTVLVADVRLANDPLALARTLGAVPGATVVPDHHTVSSSGKRTLHVSVAGATQDELDDALSRDPTVESATHVETFPDCRLYRLGLADDAVLVAPTCVELGARTLDVRGTGGEWHVSLQFPDRDAVVALREFCDGSDVRFRIDRLSEGDGVVGAPTALTSNQWETIRVAFESGYYEVPRAVTQEDLAETLGVSTSAVSHRLRRATAALVEDTLDGVVDGT
ncbi:helix-turn-helix domain-containing protein [Haloarchaeobius sp. HRN-SO-5]|uniref:helix-turn-helix domain-containing protein n=1 Tax=Haloarchaeobius sp. HRN-SO-5 TaxID=3446118 RepID=UPI003EB6FF59